MKHLILAMSLLVLVNCKDSKKEDHVTKHKTQEHVAKEAVSHEEHEKDHKQQLDG